MKLTKLETNAIQIALQTLIDNMTDLMHSKSLSDLRNHSLWTLNIMYEFLTSERDGVEENVEDGETEWNDVLNAQNNALKKITSAIIKQMKEDDELFHTDLKDIYELWIIEKNKKGDK